MLDVIGLGIYLQLKSFVKALDKSVHFCIRDTEFFDNFLDLEEAHVSA